MVLAEIYEKYRAYSDKGTRHCYVGLYESILERFRHTASLVVEIGVLSGASLYMWREFFTKATIIGVDTNPQCKAIQNPYARILVEIGDASNPDMAGRLPDGVDIIIDDGGHILEPTINSFRYLYPKLRGGGLYIVEDVQDFEAWKSGFDSFGIPYGVVDLRLLNAVYDDVLFLFKKP